VTFRTTHLNARTKTSAPVIDISLSTVENVSAIIIQSFAFVARFEMCISVATTSLDSYSTDSRPHSYPAVRPVVFSFFLSLLRPPPPRARAVTTVSGRVYTVCGFFLFGAYNARRVRFFFFLQIKIETSPRRFACPTAASPVHGPNPSSVLSTGLISYKLSSSSSSGR